MADLRWLLLAAGILVLALVFWISRREARGERVLPAGFLRNSIPASGGEKPGAPQPEQASETSPQAVAAERVITVRLMARGAASFAGEDLILALREEDLRHGRFGIFHRHSAKDDSKVTFSVASLVEPGSFDLTQLKASRFPGISLFLMLQGLDDSVASFDDMLSTARSLARKLDGELLDEQGSRLSVQRERYLREEVIRYQHNASAH